METSLHDLILFCSCAPIWIPLKKESGPKTLPLIISKLIVITNIYQPGDLATVSAWLYLAPAPSPPYHTGFWWVMNTVDPRWKNGIDFEDVNSLLHIMIRNKDTDVFLILTLPFYGTSSIRKRINTDLFRIPTGDVFHTLPFYGTSSIRKRIRTPIYSGYLPETFSTRLLLLMFKHPAANYEYILITIFMITQLNSVYFGFTSGAGVL